MAPDHEAIKLLHARFVVAGRLDGHNANPLRDKGVGAVTRSEIQRALKYLSRSSDDDGAMTLAEARRIGLSGKRQLRPSADLRNRTPRRPASDILSGIDLERHQPRVVDTILR